MRDKIVRSSTTCKINLATSKNLQIFISFRLPRLESKFQSPALFYEVLWRNLKDITAADKI